MKTASFRMTAVFLLMILVSNPADAQSGPVPAPAGMLVGKSGPPPNHRPEGPYGVLVQLKSGATFEATRKTAGPAVVCCTVEQSIKGQR